MKHVVGRLAAFRLGHALGRPIVLPASLTVSVLYACNSRCQTCHVYENKARVLTLEEYDRIFRGLGKAPRWVTLSGGEPFLRKDLAEIIELLVRHCRPAVINIPTNGSFPDRIERTVDRLAPALGGAQLIVNLSIDGVGAEHDRLRGFDGNWELALRSAEVLRALKRRHSNLRFGVHTVISRFNEDRIEQVVERVATLGADSHIAEVAEQRVELGTVGAPITPSAAGVRRALAALRARQRRTTRLIDALVQSLREEYYRVLEQWVAEPREVLPCHAAITSAHIMPEGKVWACCVLGEELGDLRASDYDFRALWYGAQATRIRARIRRERCHCPLANQAYLNLLVDPRSLVRAGARAAASLAPGPAWRSASV